MSQKTQVNLYVNHANDLQYTLSQAQQNGFDSITTPLANPLFQREFSDKYPSTRDRHIPFSRSDLIFKSGQWLNCVIGRLNDEYLDCDSDCEDIRKQAEETLKQEMQFAEHSIQNGYCMIRLKGGKTTNLSRVLSGFNKCWLLVSVPMTDPLTQQLQFRRDINAEDIPLSDTWTWWNQFRLHSDFHPKHRLALELSADIPDEEHILRWLGEPVEFLILSTRLFHRNSANYPILSKAHQTLIGRFVQKNVHFIVKGDVEDRNLRLYNEYLRHLASKFYRVDIMAGFEELLEIPLQPLYDNLDAYTYEVFEKDPVKYKQYQIAIERAMVDKVKEDELSTRELVIMIVGAGRGPLIRAALNAMENTKRRAKIIVVEKNQNAINTLSALVQEMWSEKPISVCQRDMRELELPEKADIMVSELLGSFGDNELSPECLYPAQKHLKVDGISIPSQYTSYLEPIMSSKLFNQVRSVQKSALGNLEKAQNYLPHFEYTYVCYLKNIYNIDEPKEVFVFDHPEEMPVDNSRFKSLTFEAKVDTVLNGFAGYFDTVLYKDVTLSTHPMTHTPGMASWFSMFIPLGCPVQVKRGERIEVNVWRCVGKRKVWYEWSLTSPVMTHVHNQKGRACDILM